VFDNPQLDIDTNLKVLIETLEACRDKPVTFNFVSSWFVYGGVDLPAKESAHCSPRGFYSITKKAAEDLLVSYCRTFKIKYRIFRLANIIGPGDKFSKKKNALQFIAKKLTQNLPIDLYDGGGFIRDYLYVEDACRAMKLAMEKAPAGEIINIGSGLPQQFKSVIDKLVAITGSISELKSIPPPEFHEIVQVRDMWLDTSKLKSMGFEQSWSIDKSLESLLRDSE